MRLLDFARNDVAFGGITARLRRALSPHKKPSLRPTVGSGANS